MRIRYLPVLDGQQLVGVISIGDVVRAIINEQEQELEQLENINLGRQELE